MKIRSLFFSLLLFIMSSIKSQLQFTLGNSYAIPGWYKIGRLSLDQQGRDAIIRISGGYGYNASISQNSEGTIHFRTSNAYASNNGFYASGSYYNIGRNKILNSVRVIQIDLATWDFYANLPGFTGEAATLFIESAEGTWAKDFAYVNAAPSSGVFNDLPEELVIQSNSTFSQSVGIGTSDTGPYKLAVEGLLGARKIKVTQAPMWADYVFNKDYKLKPLTELEQFIKANKHLPDVPSAKEIAQDGIDVGDNQAILLKKIEELTLYMIAIKKENEQLKQENILSQKRYTAICSRLEKIEKNGKK